ncbi:hypothetical protein Emed_002197 [Eimeria media]
MLLGVRTPGGRISSSFLRVSALSPSPRRAANAARLNFAAAAAAGDKAAAAAAAAGHHWSYPHCSYLITTSSNSSSTCSKLLCSAGVRLPRQQHVVQPRQQQQQQQRQQQRLLFNLTSSLFQLGEQQQQVLQHKESRVSRHLKEEYWSVDSGILPVDSAGPKLHGGAPTGGPPACGGPPSRACGEEEVFDGFLQISLGLAEDRFVSRVACMQRGDTWKIRCSAVDSAVFQTLETCWTFTDRVGDAGCHIEFYTSFSVSIAAAAFAVAAFAAALAIVIVAVFQGAAAAAAALAAVNLRSALYQQLARVFLREVAARMTSCFEARVGALYPKPHAGVAAGHAAAAAAAAAAAPKPLQGEAAAERPEAVRPPTAQQQLQLQQQEIETVGETAEWRLSPQASQGVWQPRDVALLLRRLEQLQNPGLAATTAAAAAAASSSSNSSNSSSSKGEDRLTCGEARALRVLLCSRWGLQAVGAAFLAFDNLQQQQQQQQQHEQQRALLTALRDLSHAADLTHTSGWRKPKKTLRMASLLRRLFPSSNSNSSSNSSSSRGF